MDGGDGDGLQDRSASETREGPAAPIPAPGPTGAPDPAGSAPGRRPAGPATAAVLRALTIYSLLRLALVIALTAALALVMPLIVALLFAVIVQLPLSWLLFARQRSTVTAAIAESTRLRRAERARLQAALTGDEPPPA